jgi:hypothetical protein
LRESLREHWHESSQEPPRKHALARRCAIITACTSPLPSVVQHDRIAELVACIIDARKKDTQVDTSALEREIDQQGYALYGLTPEEIAVVEGTPK